jgi:hypothetical protein
MNKNVCIDHISINEKNIVVASFVNGNCCEGFHEENTIVVVA